MSLKMNTVSFFIRIPPFPQFILDPKIIYSSAPFVACIPIALTFSRWCVEICNSIWTIFTPFKMFQFWRAMSAISQELIFSDPIIQRERSLEGIILTKLLEAKSPVMLIEVIFALLNKSCFYPPLYVYKTSVLCYKSCMSQHCFLLADDVFYQIHPIVVYV